jgi:redox-sensitive bicupin YhaK (pirin superfamily)
MNAGMGIIHSERPPKDIHEQGGRQEIIQLWINTPAAHKMDQPQYFPVSAAEVPTVTLDDGKVTARIFAGSVLDHKGPIPSFTEVNAVTLELKAGGKISTPLPADHNTFLYILSGQATIEGHGLVEGLNAVVFKKDGEGIALQALEDTRILLMSAKPLDEAVVSHGPFVMNTQTQVLEAMRDYQMGKMGVLM